MLTFPKKFERDYGFRFTIAKTVDIAADHTVSSFFPKSSVATCKWFIWVAMDMMRCPASLKFVQN